MCLKEPVLWLHLQEQHLNTTRCVVTPAAAVPQDCQVCGHTCNSCISKVLACLTSHPALLLANPHYITARQLPVPLRRFLASNVELVCTLLVLQDTLHGREAERCECGWQNLC
ncbi:hypothetical protein OTU49_006745 [Cherax quadricarinatus]|uniref:Uncharacterized protein n=1 Tax=Cherax quadricarinatus TaxID=27406 RepID=A0AAW0WLS2_CHEQU